MVPHKATRKTFQEEFGSFNIDSNSLAGLRSYLHNCWPPAIALAGCRCVTGPISQLPAPGRCSGHTTVSKVTDTGCVDEHLNPVFQELSSLKSPPSCTSRILTDSNQKAAVSTCLQ